MMKHSDKEEEINCFNFLLLSAEKDGWNVRGGAIIFLFSFNPQNGRKQKREKNPKKWCLLLFVGCSETFSLLNQKNI
jgi:hypothetical protein